MAFFLTTAAPATIIKCSKLFVNSDPETKVGFVKGFNSSCKVPLISLAVKNQAMVETVNGKMSVRHPILSEGRDGDEDYGPICPGCGVFMQDMNPDLPGFYKVRNITQSQLEDEDEIEDDVGVEDDVEDEVKNEYLDDDGDDLDDEDVDLDDEDEDLDDEDEDLDDEDEGFDDEDDGFDDLDDEFDWESEELGGKKKDPLAVDGFTPAGVGYGNITEETLEKGRKKRLSKAERKKVAKEEAAKEKDEVTVCARCHSLRNYGKVKNQTAENLIPDFDFDRLIATRLMKPTGNASSSVVVMVVDCVDFDGSFPKRAAKSLFKVLEDPKLRKKLPKLVLVATKVDLLPSQISPTRLDRWVRHRAKAAGAPKLNGVYLVSCFKDLGVKNLLGYIKELAGPRGNVWVIGAQNAGKSTLINALAKKQGAKITKLTEAAVPGTTLGILRIGGILSAKAKMFDTPGLLHPYLMSMRLNRDEQKMIEMRKELQPRTYRVKVGQSVHVGGLVRLDLTAASVETIYITVWVSSNVSLHMGKIENADQTFKGHAGVRLQPPIGEERAEELGKWEEREIQVSGKSWDVTTMDVAVAGFGWFSLGLKGDATLTLWTYSGVELTLREPLVLDRAPFILRPGFCLPKSLSEAIGNQNKLEAQTRKKIQDSFDLVEQDTTHIS